MKRTLAAPILLVSLSFGLAVQAKEAPPTDPPERLTCIRQAVSVREASILSALDTYHSGWRSQIGLRRDALLKAWQIPDRKQRKQKIQQILNRYREQRRMLQKTFKDVRRSVWRQYKEAAKSCGLPADDGSGEGMDSEG